MRHLDQGQRRCSIIGPVATCWPVEAPAISHSEPALGHRWTWPVEVLSSFIQVLDKEILYIWTLFTFPVGIAALNGASYLQTIPTDISGES